MRKSKQFVAMPVISLEEGKQIGTVKGLIIDPVKKEACALIIEEKGWFKEQKFIPFNKINSVGSDALTVEQSGSIQKGTSIPDIFRLYKEKIDIIGTKIVTEKGTALGYVDEFYIDLINGTITGIEFSGKLIDNMLKGKAFLAVSHIRTMGKEVVVTYEEAVDNIIKLEGGIQDTVKNLKDSTSHIWDTTVKRTKEISNSLSSNISKPFEKHKKNSQNQQKDNDSNIEENISKNLNPIEKNPTENNLDTGEPVPPKSIE